MLLDQICVCYECLVRQIRGLISVREGHLVATVFFFSHTFSIIMWMFSLYNLHLNWIFFLKMHLGSRHHKSHQMIIQVMK